MLLSESLTQLSLFGGKEQTPHEQDCISLEDLFRPTKEIVSAVTIHAAPANQHPGVAMDGRNHDDLDSHEVVMG
jgi:hypothetical protein